MNNSLYATVLITAVFTLSIKCFSNDLYSCKGDFAEVPLRYEVATSNKDGEPKISFKIFTDTDRKFYIQPPNVPTAVSKYLHLYFMVDFRSIPIPSRDWLSQFSKARDGTFSIEINSKTPLESEIYIQADYPKLYEILKKQSVHILWSFEAYVQDYDPWGIKAVTEPPPKLYLSPIGGLLKLDKMASLSDEKK